MNGMTIASYAGPQDNQLLTNLWRSILQHNPQAKFDFLVFDGGMTPGQRLRLLNSTRQFKNCAHLTFIGTGADSKKRHPILSTDPFGYDSGQFLNYLSRVLYLDQHLVCTSSLAPLWQFELGGKALAVNQPHLDAQVILLDLTRWRQQKIAQQVAALTPDFVSHYRQHELAVLEHVLANQWALLSTAHCLRTQTAFKALT